MDDKTVIRFPNDNTLIRPRPGGKRQSMPHSSTSDRTKISYLNNQQSSSKRIYGPSSRDYHPDRPALIKMDSDEKTSANSLNELVHNTSTLLSLMITLSHLVIHKNVPKLKQKLQDEIKQFEINSAQAGISNDKILQARYILCTCLDEVVASTPWGQESDWSQQSLLSLFHGETWGGEKFYLLLERFQKEPVKNLDILELMYICMSLGFQGKYRVLDNGFAEVEHLREDLYQQLRSFKKDFNKELSNNWRGVSDKRSALIRYVPLWVVGALSGVILLAMFSSFTYMLDQSSTPVIREIIKLGPAVISPAEHLESIDEVDESYQPTTSQLPKNERLVKPPQKKTPQQESSLIINDKLLQTLRRNV